VTDLENLDALGLAQLVDKGELTPQELLDDVAARTERLDPEVNAVVIRAFDKAQEAIDAGLPEGPFRGVPFLLKDIHAEWAGVEYTQASRFLEGYVPPADAPITQRYKQAGLVLAGRTNCSEFGLLSTEPELYGPTRNPWNLDHTVGGSSGGSAAAVAARIVPAAHGNDGFGSIRIPAACCGVFGFKPTRNRTIGGSGIGGLAVDHAITISVRDSAALLDVVRGTTQESPYHAVDPERPYPEEVGRAPGRLRVAFSTASLDGRSYAPPVAAAVRDTAALLEALGHDVEEGAPKLPRSPQEFQEQMAGMSAPALRGQVDMYAEALGRTPSPELFEPYTWMLYEQAPEVSGLQVLMGMQYMELIAHSVVPFFNTYDVWLNATCATPPPPLGAWSFSGDEPAHGWEAVDEWEPPLNASLANFTGQPAMSVPLAWTDDDLPIGLQFFGHYGDEASLFRLASQLEEARPWADKRPSLS